MQELKLNKAAVKVIWEGQEYIVRKPTLGKALELERAATEGGDKPANDLNTVIEFLVEAGLPKEVLMEFDAESVEQLMKALMPAKKN